MPANWDPDDTSRRGAELIMPAAKVPSVKVTMDARTINHTHLRGQHIEIGIADIELIIDALGDFVYITEEDKDYEEYGDYWNTKKLRRLDTIANRMVSMLDLGKELNLPLNREKKKQFSLKRSGRALDG